MSIELIMRLVLDYGEVELKTAKLLYQTAKILHPLFNQFPVRIGKIVCTSHWETSYFERLFYVKSSDEWLRLYECSVFIDKLPEYWHGWKHDGDYNEAQNMAKKLLTISIALNHLELAVRIKELFEFSSSSCLKGLIMNGRKSLFDQMSQESDWRWNNPPPEEISRLIASTAPYCSTELISQYIWNSTGSISLAGSTLSLLQSSLENYSLLGLKFMNNLRPSYEIFFLRGKQRLVPPFQFEFLRGLDQRNHHPLTLPMIDFLQPLLCPV